MIAPARLALHAGPRSRTPQRSPAAARSRAALKMEIQSQVRTKHKVVRSYPTLKLLLKKRADPILECEGARVGRLSRRLAKMGAHCPREGRLRSPKVPLLDPRHSLLALAHELSRNTSALRRSTSCVGEISKFSKSIRPVSYPILPQMSAPILPICHTRCFPRHRPILLLNLTAAARLRPRRSGCPLSPKHLSLAHSRLVSKHPSHRASQRAHR